MRHRNKIRKLGRTKAHRKATLRNLASALIQHQQIKTTLAKAKAAQSVIEKLITNGKKDTVAARRQVFKLLQNHSLVQKLFNEIAPTFAERSGGYTRIIKLGHRDGDAAEMAILQLVGFEPMIVEEKKPSEKKKATPSKKKAKKAEEEKPAEEKKAAETETTSEKTEKAEEKKEEKSEKKPAEKKAKKASSKKSKEKKETKASSEKKETKKKSTRSKPKSDSDKKEEKS